MSKDYYCFPKRTLKFREDFFLLHVKYINKLIESRRSNTQTNSSQNMGIDTSYECLTV